MTDMLVRLEGSRCALVGGYYEDQIFLSMRTRDSQINAGKLIQRVVGKLGRAGGHGSMSAGRIKMEEMSEKEKGTIEGTLIRRLKKAMKITGTRGKKLVQ